ncbi:MAG: ASCH domain-containing protein [Gaiellaceae bacterium]
MRKLELGFQGTPQREQLVAAVLRGERTASAGLLVDHAVLRIADTELALARDEGEGFASVAEWRAAHDRFWRSYADELRAYLGDPDWDATDDTLYVAERFRLVELL